MWGTDIAGYLETLRSLYEINISNELASEIFRQRMRYSRTYIAVEGNVVMGAASLVLEQKYGHGGKFAGRIEDVAVRQGYQRRGIGLALTKHVIAEGKKLNCYKISLGCKEHLQDFYVQAGMHKHDLEMRIDL